MDSRVLNGLAGKGLFVSAFTFDATERTQNGHEPTAEIDQTVHSGPTDE